MVVATVRLHYFYETVHLLFSLSSFYIQGIHILPFAPRLYPLGIAADISVMSQEILKTKRRKGLVSETHGFIEARTPTAAEKGGHPTPGTVEEDVPLTQEDIHFVAEFRSSGRADRTIRKLDYRIIPILAVIYLAAFLDR